MEKLNKRIEVITDLVTLKMTDSKEEGMYDVLINHNLDGINLVMFKFDGEKLFMETPKKNELEKYLKRQKEAEEKLNRQKTQQEIMQDARELRDLPTELEEITVLYRKSPDDKIINMISYINDILGV